MPRLKKRWKDDWVIEMMRKLLAILTILLMSPIMVAAQGPLVGDASLPPDFDSVDADQKTSEIMIGKIAVGIILPESDGSIDPSTEDWTAQERQKVFSEIVAGMNWWAARESRANLTFYYDDHFTVPLNTGYEPIGRPHTDRCLWISQAMGELGYNDPSCFARVRDYNNTLRNQYQTDWSFTIFVVDSSNDRDNKFSDGYFAYAFLGGPFMVMTYGNDGYGINQMDMVTAHELGHIFRALDQVGIPCQWTSGCADVLNRNSNVQPGCVQQPMPSIMKFAPGAWWSGSVDRWARGQVGWVDENCNDIFDCVDPDVETDYCFCVYLPLILSGAVQP